MLFGLSDWLLEGSLTMYDNLEFVIRIVLAAVLGGAIGLERTRRHKEAGIRTHCIIAITSAVFMILSKYAFLDMVDITGTVGAKGADPSRIASQVVSGISFLGAGVIFRQGNSTKGLTTAAGMWATSSVGMAVGAGMYWIGVVETMVLILAQNILHQRFFRRETGFPQTIKIVIDDKQELLDEVRHLIDRHGGHINEWDVAREGDQLQIKIGLRMTEPILYDETIQFMQNNDGVKLMKI